MGRGEEDAWDYDLDALRTAVRALAQTVVAIDSASDRVRLATSGLEALEQEATELQRLRLAAVADLRTAGISYDLIASMTGLSKARVAQLSRAARKE